MSFNILRIQFIHSIRTFGIRCSPFQNKSITIPFITVNAKQNKSISKPFITVNAKFIASLSNNNNASKALFGRQYVTSIPSRRSSKSIVEREKAKEWGEMTIGQKVVGAAKVTTNISIIAIGIGVFGVIIYFALKELFSSSGSTKMFSETLEKIRSNSECQKILGTPIKAHGGSSSSGRRRNRLVRFQEVTNTDGSQHKLMQFYLEGSVTHGIALLDMIKNNKGIWVTKYLVVSIPGYNKKIFVEYNDDVNKENDKEQETD
ncbi:TIM21-domain-containing protein [Glomus cerebriforme]|uniref:Mitochondrial import inner membrane translocase subunit Tim21 n=1 Tax=Glomus cerebriforme TaxID=658196 RepID=A0A397TAW3_9GLOM|nr:TIM21-domain-containing protein [Glomus cerebriforme]